MHGTINRIDGITSSYFEVPTVEVWLPNDYDSKKAYPVIYMHDGQSLFDPKLTWNNQAWEVDKSLTRLIDLGKIPPCIVVSIWHHEKTRNTDYLPQKPFNTFPTDFRHTLTGDGNLKVHSEAYLKFIVLELKPFIDANYATLPNFENTFMIGASMGALISLYALCEYPQVFGGVACMSTHWILVLEENSPAPKAFVNYLRKNLPAASKHKIYFDLGTGFFDNRYIHHQNEVDRLMIKKGYSAKNWQTLIFQGHTHSEEYWCKRFPGVVEFLLS